MKFRNLKKGQWAIQFDFFQQYSEDHYEAQIFCDNGKLKGFAVSEYDNGLYTQTSNYQFDLTWSDLKWNLTHYNLRHQKHNRMPYYVYKYTGKCRYCKQENVQFIEDFCYGWVCTDCEVARMRKYYLEEE